MRQTILRLAKQQQRHRPSKYGQMAKRIAEGKQNDPKPKYIETRRTGGRFDVFLAGVFGVGSGWYIFNEPIALYFLEQQEEQQARESQEASGASVVN
mmetsp:Transcript_14602/g.21561  ORF Transcript_14602/g.21561 Transcript_14602/m.21561 type:complete len:97 (-) Transcript_14602:195-485(-)